MYTKVLSILLGGVAALSLSAGCRTNDNASDPACYSALGNLYGVGCTLTVGGERLSESEAVSHCEERESMAEVAGCMPELNVVLVCHDSIRTSEDCWGCNPTWGELSACP